MIGDSAIGLSSPGAGSAVIVPGIVVNVSMNGSYAYFGVMSATVETDWRFTVSYGYKGNMEAHSGLSVALASTYKYSATTNAGVITGAALHGSYAYDKGVGIRLVEFVSIHGSYGYRSQLSATFRHSVSISGSYSYGVRFAAYTPQAIFDWSEGVAYRVVRKDQSPAGLQQGGIKRDRLFSTIQRLGL